MAQYIYLVAAMLGMMTLIMTSQRGTERTRQTEMVNEVSTQLTNAAAEVMETVGRAYFDQYNFQEKDNKYVGGGAAGTYAYCGRVPAGEESARLTDPDDFGTAGVRCGDFGTCPYIEGFHDLTPGDIEAGGADTTLTRGDFTVNVEVEVAYVNPADYSVVATAPTFAKQVTVTAHTPDAFLGDDPAVFDNQLQLSLVRVFTYTCPTDPNSLPLPAGGQTCASIGAAPVCAVDNGA